jgi:hypothetical protein
LTCFRCQADVGRSQSASDSTIDLEEARSRGIPGQLIANKHEYFLTSVVNAKRRRYASPQAGMKTGTQGARCWKCRMGRYRPPAVWCIEPVRERGRDALWEQEIEAPAARGEARIGKNRFVLASFAPAAGGSMSNTAYRRCRGMDVHKDMIVVCVLPPDGQPGSGVRKR